MSDDNKVDFSRLSHDERKVALKKLIEIRGKEDGLKAIVVFTHRCALRLLPQLGKRRLEKIWTKQPYWYFFTVVRANIASRQWLTAEIESSKLSSIARDARDARDVAAYVAADAAVVAADADAVADAAFADADAFADAAFAVAAYAADADADAAADYHYLSNANNSLTDLLTQPLWPSQTPIGIKQLQRQLFSNLQHADLAFIASDIQALLDGSFSPSQGQKYLADISRNEIRNATDLRKFLASAESVETATVDNYAVRALLVGPGGAGKTSLARLIEAGEQSKKPTKPTTGIDCKNHQAINLKVHENIINAENMAKKLDIYLWDFGGQAIYHSLHHAFMHENCVYIVVVDSRHEQAPEPWLHQIQNSAGNGAQVLVVTNWFDGITTQQNRRGLMRQFPNLLDENSFFDFSCQTINDADFARFINRLVVVSSESTKKIFKETQEAFDLLNQEFAKENIIEFNVLKGSLLQKFPNLEDGELKSLMVKLKEFGRYVELGYESKKASEKYLCLNPDYTVEKAYQFVYNDNVREGGGSFNTKGVTRNDKTRALITENIIDFMCQHGVCVRLDDYQHFIPDAAPIDEPTKLTQILRSDSIIQLVYELPYLPIGLRAKVASALINDNYVAAQANKKEIWRDGFIARDPKARANNCIVLEYQARKNRIVLNLVGDYKLSANLLKIIDNQLVISASKNNQNDKYGREILGFPIFVGQPKNKQAYRVEQKSVAEIDGIYQDLVQLTGLNILLVAGSDRKVFVG